MKILKTIMVTKEVVDKVICDLCKDEIVQKPFQVSEAKVELKIGEAFPDHGNGELLSFDVCRKCFVTKLIVWFFEQGAEVTTNAWEY